MYFLTMKYDKIKFGLLDDLHNGGGRGRLMAVYQVMLLNSGEEDGTRAHGIAR